MVHPLAILGAIPLGLVSIPRKFELGGDYAADLRLSGLESAKAQIKRLGKSGKLTQEQAVALLADIKSLHKSNDNGWFSGKETTALIRVVKALGEHKAESLVEEVVKQTENVSDQVRFFRDEVGKRTKGARKRVKDTYEEIRSRLGG